MRPRPPSDPRYVASPKANTPPSRRDRSVSLPRSCCRDTDDRLIEVGARERPEEVGIPEREDSAVSRDEPILPVLRGCDPDDGLVQMRRSHGAIEVRVAVGEDSAVGRDEPIAVRVRHHCDAGNGFRQRQARCASVKVGANVHRDRAVGLHSPGRPAVGGLAGDDRCGPLIARRCSGRCCGRPNQEQCGCKAEHRPSRPGPSPSPRIERCRRVHGHAPFQSCLTSRFSAESPRCFGDYFVAMVPILAMRVKDVPLA